MNVHDESGDVMLTTGSLKMDAMASMSEQEIDAIAKCIDGHFLPFIRMLVILCLSFLVLVFFYRYALNSNAKTKQFKND